jgi:predicted Rossmann-fold nucleotide-binding protein
MKVIVAGGRNFSDYQLLCKTLDFYFQNLDKDELTIVSGAARGADSLGERYAREKGYKIERYPADWNGPHKKGAGFARNREMAEVSDALVAFPGGNGTAHMIRTAKELGLKVRVVE